MFCIVVFLTFKTICICWYHDAESLFKTQSTRRRHKHCALAVVKQSQKFHPVTDLLPGARDGQNLSAGDGHYLYLQIQFGEDRCTQFQLIVVTDPHTHTHRQDRLHYTALQLACTGFLRRPWIQGQPWKSLNFIKLKMSLNCFGKRVEGLEKFGICLCETFNKTWWLGDCENFCQGRRTA